MDDRKQDLTGGASCDRKPYERGGEYEAGTPKNQLERGEPLLPRDVNIKNLESAVFISSNPAKLQVEKPADNIRKAFENERRGAFLSHRGDGFISLARTRAAIAGSLAGTVDAIEEELTALNARKELLEEELYKYKAAADLMLKQMTNEQN